MSRVDSTHFERQTVSRDSELNQYFVPGEGINREVLQKEIRRYLGPKAYARPYVHNGAEGYALTAVRPFTPEMLDELMKLSNAYEKMARDRRDHGIAALSYEDFEACRREETAFAKSGTGYTSSQGKEYAFSPGSLHTRVLQSREYAPSQENAYGYQNTHSSDYSAVYGTPQHIMPCWNAYKSQFTGSILCSSCQEQARRGQEHTRRGQEQARRGQEHARMGPSITLCRVCRSEIASILESCDKSSSSHNSAVAMLASLLVGVVAGGVMGAEYAAWNIIRSLRR